MNAQISIKPTAFDLVRYAYFSSAFGDVLKAIRGGTTPVGVITLAMCSISTLSEIEWSIANQSELEASGELPPKKKLSVLGYQDKTLFEAWLQRWMHDSNINPQCEPGRVYGVRCALVHTAGASESLTKTGVKAWMITANDPSSHYSESTLRAGDELRFSLDMPSFLAELFLAADQFLVANKSTLESASDRLRKRVGFLALQLSSDCVQLVDNQSSLAWFDPELSKSPLSVSKDYLSERIRAFYYEAANTGLVTQ